MACIGTKSTGFLLILIVFIVNAASAKPKSLIENQDVDEYQPNLSDYYNQLSQYPSNADSMQLDKMQMLYRQPNSWDNIFRLPETKRQIRYRQCYFNPVSCFKK